MPERLERIRQRITDACARSGRSPDDVTLVAVAKTFGPDAVVEAAGLGLEVIGESKIQEARQKMGLCPSHLQWHMIGHLQSNKCRDAVRIFRMIHSVDSLRLLEKVDGECRAAGVDMPVCVEVNVSGEASKFGCRPEDVPALLEGSRRCMNVSIVGFMTMPPFTEEVEGARPFFRRLRELRDQWNEGLGLDIRGLSMGMSRDFEIAVEEGATWIRVGSDLFGERPRRVAKPEEDLEM